MKKDIPNSPVVPEQLQKIIRRNEPRLHPKEKQAIWANIEQRTLKRTSRNIRLWTWYAAASVILVAIGSWAIMQHPHFSDPYKRMANLVSVDTLNHVCLYIDKQQIELGEQVEIHCLPATNQIEVRTLSNTSFKLSVPQQKETYMQIAVPAGKKAQVVLADQSKITVREQSKFSFPLQLAGKSRNVHLEGEAYMSVAPNTAKRFIVETQNLNVTVLGTEFLVSAYPQRAEQSVLLVSGSVEIHPSQGKKIHMAPNQRYIYNSTTQKATLVSGIDPDPHISWKEDMLIMNDEPLSSVLKQIENIYQVSLNYDWNELQGIRLNGKLDISAHLDEVLDRLSRIAPIQLDKSQRKITSSKTLKNP